MSEEIKTLSIGASYDFGLVKLFGELSQVRDHSMTTIPVRVLPASFNEEDKYNGGLVGLSIPVGAGLIKTAYSSVKFDNGRRTSSEVVIALGDDEGKNKTKDQDQAKVKDQDKAPYRVLSWQDNVEAGRRPRKLAGR
jgi:hypothetical protein